MSDGLGLAAPPAHVLCDVTRPFAEAFTEMNYADSLLRNRMMNEMFHESVPVILHEDDLNAMYYSIENRSPRYRQVSSSN